jgi:hypothetical protein
MHTHIYYLTPEENTVLNLIAEGITTKHILAKCPMPPSGFHIFSAELKRKIGISGKLSEGIGPFMSKYSLRIPINTYSSDHLRALRQFLTGQRYFSFMPPAEFQAMLTEACESAAIFTTDERARKSAIRLFLALFHYNGKPLSPLEEQILRAMADGLPFEVITTLIPSQRTTFVKFKAREACQRLYFDAQGRNAQRNLLRAYFAWIDAHKTNPMDDPLF